MTGPNSEPLAVHPTPWLARSFETVDSRPNVLRVVDHGRGLGLLQPITSRRLVHEFEQ